MQTKRRSKYERMFDTDDFEIFAVFEFNKKDLWHIKDIEIPIKTFNKHKRFFQLLDRKSLDWDKIEVFFKYKI